MSQGRALHVELSSGSLGPHTLFVQFFISLSGKRNIFFDCLAVTVPSVSRSCSLRYVFRVSSSLRVSVVLLFHVSLNLPWVHTLLKYLCDAHPTSVLPCVLAHEIFSAATATQMLIAAGLFAERGRGLYCSLPRKWLNCGYIVGTFSGSVGMISPAVLERCYMVQPLRSSHRADEKLCPRIMFSAKCDSLWASKEHSEMSLEKIKSLHFKLSQGR